MTDRNPQEHDASADPYNGELAADADLGDGEVAEEPESE